MRRATAHIAISVRRFFWFISIHFVAIHCWSVLQPKIAKKNH